MRYNLSLYRICGFRGSIDACAGVLETEICVGCYYEFRILYLFIHSFLHILLRYRICWLMS